MKLYSMPNTCALAPTIVIKWLKLPVAITTLQHGDNRKPEYLKIHPLGKVPALELGTGHILTEAAAILRFLAEMSPEAGLDGADSVERARIAEALSVMTSEVHANWVPFFVPDRFYGDPSGYEQLKAKTFERLSDNYRLLDKQLDNKDHLVFARRTVADSYLYVLTRWADLLPGGLDLYPALSRFRQRMELDSGVQDALRACGTTLKRPSEPRLE